MSKYSDFINGLRVIDGIVCDRLPEWVPGAFEFYGEYFKPRADFGLLAGDMVKGRFYMSTAFDVPVKLIDIDYVGPDGGAAVTVLYNGGLYTDCSFRMAPYNAA